MRRDEDHLRGDEDITVQPADIDDVVALAGLARRFHVEASLQGRGIGRRLMLAALSGPELAGAPRIFLRVSEDNERALALYARLGFRRATASHFTTGATPGGDLVMVLDRRRAR